jgi:hypothetical protein
LRAKSAIPAEIGAMSSLPGPTSGPPWSIRRRCVAGAHVVVGDELAPRTGESLVAGVHVVVGDELAPRTGESLVAGVHVVVGDELAPV